MLMEGIRRQLLAIRILRCARKDEKFFSGGRGRTDKSYHCYLARSEKQDKLLRKAIELPENKRVLLAYNKTPDDLPELHEELLRSGIGISESALVIIAPKYLYHYLTKKEEGLSTLALGAYMRTILKT
jgi:hypothetical protein